MRTVAEHSKGVFPAKLGRNKEIMESLMDQLPQDKVLAEINKVLAKYGGRDKLVAEYGKKLPPAIMAEIHKSLAPLSQKHMQGITFYMGLKPENDPYYVGGKTGSRTQESGRKRLYPFDCGRRRILFGIRGRQRPGFLRPQE